MSHVYYGAVHRHKSMPSAGFETNDTSKRAAADPRLRLRGRRDRLPEVLGKRNFAFAQIVYVN